VIDFCTEPNNSALSGNLDLRHYSAPVLTAISSRNQIEADNPTQWEISLYKTSGGARVDEWRHLECNIYPERHVDQHAVSELPPDKRCDIERHRRDVTARRSVVFFVLV